MALAFVLATAVAAQAPRGPSTPKERAKALELVEVLETEPASRAAAEATTWLVGWLAAIPDITVHVCLEPLGTAREIEDVPASLTLQPAFSQAAYSIRHPEAPADGVATYVAGVEGALRAYRAMRGNGAVGPLAPFEELEAAREAGKLEKLVARRSRKCRAGR